MLAISLETAGLITERPRELTAFRRRPVDAAPCEPCVLALTLA